MQRTWQNIIHIWNLHRELILLNFDSRIFFNLFLTNGKRLISHAQSFLGVDQLHHPREYKNLICVSVGTSKFAKLKLLS